MEGKDNIQRPYKGLITDTSPFDQPKESYSYALNAVSETREGDSNFLSMENAIQKCNSLPIGTVPIGKCYLYDDNIAVWLVGNNKSYIGIINKFNEYEPYVETNQLKLSLNHPVNATFRLRRNNTRVIYWVDGLNVPRLFNFDRPSDFYSIGYHSYLAALPVGGTDIFASEKWEDIHFDLIKRYDYIPEFRSAEILNTGNIVSGSYSIAIQLVDANLNPTEWITTSNPVNIFVDSLNTNYSTIRGSRGIQSTAQSFINATKSIKWTLGNLDPNFSYYRIAVLCANQGDGNINQALVSGLRIITNNTFIYNGGIGDLTETPLTDILETKLDIASAKYIEQLENRLILGSIKGTQIEWCSFQRYASRIKSELVTSTIKLEDITNEGNVKNPTTPFVSKIGNMWGEVYSYGIVYILAGGLESPVFHIPGRPSTKTNGLDFYECADGNTYIDIDPCLSSDYWGNDAWGNPIVGQPIRHHKFPVRSASLKAANKQDVICGIKFTNIDKPHPDIIGFRIVRNERTDEDKIIFDHVLIGPLVSDNNDPENNYHAFGLMFPEVDSTKRSTLGAYIFSPEHQFLKKPVNFDEIEVIGSYLRGNKFIPTYRDEDSGTGAYVQDVSPGTSYNPEYHKTKDPDGFDLQIMYRSSECPYSLNKAFYFPEVKAIHHLAATGHVISDTEILFNASTDNKIVIAEFETPLSDMIFESSGQKRLIYAALKKNNISCYSGFMTRSYFKEHNNMIPFDVDHKETHEIYNGDCYTSPMTIVSTMYEDFAFASRTKKSKVWKIILGAVLIVAGIVGAIFTAGTSLSLTVIGAASLMAISFGVSMLTSGIQFETLKNMIDEHYEAGLKSCIEDNDNWITKNNDGIVTSSSYLDPVASIIGFPVSVSDDKFCWFADRLENIYFDSSVNMGLRSGLTVGLSDFVNSPSKQPANATNEDLYTASREQFESYLINKMTIVDREQGDGRLYIGMPTSEFYDINLDYLRKNKEKIYNYLPLEYDCCAANQEDFRGRIHYSEQSYQEELLDNYRVFLPNNYRDIEGNTGEITNLFRYNNALYIHTSEALYHLPQNLQQQVTSELVTFIGTGDFFAIPPRKVSDGAMAVGGSKHHQATIVTEFGVFFVSETEEKVFIYSDKLNDITVGNTHYFKNNLKSYLHKSIANTLGKGYVTDYDNVFSKNMVGIHAVYDERYERIILTKIDYNPLVAYELYIGTNAIGKFVFDFTTKKFGIINKDRLFIPIEFTNKEYFENKSFTMSYSLKTKSWVSWHSYLPRIYVSSPNNLYSFIENDNSIYLHNIKEKFCNVYNKIVPFIVELNSISNPLVVRIWNHIAINAIVRRFHPDFDQFIDDNDHFFEIMTINNERQLSGAIHLKVKSAKAEPENWMLQQITDQNHEGIVNRLEGTWFINDFRDFVIDKQQPLFSKNWMDIKNSFPIDKIINQNAIDLNKDWTELESFRGKYLTIRLAYYGENTDSDIQITVNYVVDNEQQSIR